LSLGICFYIVSQRVAEDADGRQEAVDVTEVFLVEIMG